MLLLLLLSRSVMRLSRDSMRSRRWQPTRLPRPWDSPGTGVGCHFLLQCMKVKSESEVAQSCPTLSDPIHGIFHASVLEWGAIAFSDIYIYILISIYDISGRMHKKLVIEFACEMGSNIN